MEKFKLKRGLITMLKILVFVKIIISCLKTQKFRYNNYSSFVIIWRILSPQLDHIIAAIDVFHGKRILARNKNTCPANCRNILKFQVEQTTILNLRKNIYSLWQLFTFYTQIWYTLYLSILMFYFMIRLD